jgi:broad specificity phosphatase PhoE
MIIVIRHGTREDRYAWRHKKKVKNDTDPYLSDIGREQAFHTGEKIKDFLPSSSKLLIITSPYVRCLQTAENFLIGLGKKKRILNNTVYVEDAVRELVFHEEIEKKYDDIYFFRKPYEFVGLDLEYNKLGVFERVDKKLREGVEKDRGTGRAWSCIEACREWIGKDPDLVVVLVTHSFFTRALGKKFLKGIEKEVIVDCSTSVIEVEKEGLRLRKFNQNLFN